MAKKPLYVNMDDPDAEKMVEDNIDGYAGLLSANAGRRSYIDIEPNISVRTDFLRRDYDRFRPGEAVPDDSKAIIRMCMAAYDKVGIIKNVIDLMGDFASQGITLNHPNSSIQTFYRNWWRKVNGTERSERFLNNLYRCGNTIIRRQYGKLNKKKTTEMSKAAVDMVEIKNLEIESKRIPFKYDILNPLSITTKGGVASLFAGTPTYMLNISPLLARSLREAENADVFNSLPKSIKDAVNKDQKKIELDKENVLVFHYKKDDWQLWANPMIYAILDDIMMFEKMKLADLSALDGAISNIRLWRLGSLEHKIMPQRPAIDKLRDILASNVGGGTMDLVWGPEIDFKESSTQIYKFLGNEKYQPVLNSIYAGLGIPPTLTGIAGQSGGYTNNFISLKTLIDRLEYGRNILCGFWEEEIKIVQKAMGFPTPATLHFDQMIVADESTEKNLLIELADRNVISYETLRERLNENPSLEEKRVNSEFRTRKRMNVPPKADPYHNGDYRHEMEKIGLQQGLVDIGDVTDLESSRPPLPLTKTHTTPKPAPSNFNSKKEPPKDNGRPKFQKDTKPRKQKTVLPKSKPNTSKALIWAMGAYKKIGDIINKPLIESFGKKNLRELTQAEYKTLTSVKISVLSNLDPFHEIDPEAIHKTLSLEINKTFYESLIDLRGVFLEDERREPTVEEEKNLICLAYVLTFCE